MRRNFAQISLNLPEKNSKENDLKKKRLHFFSCWVNLFKSKHNSSTIVELTQISPNLPEKNKIKHGLQKKKKRLHLDFGCHFCKIKAHTAILRTVSQILPKFPQIFTKSKILGVQFHPHLLHQWTHYMFCGTPVEKHWPTFSGVLVNTTVLMLLLKSVAGKKCFSRGALANTARFLRFYCLETLPCLAADGITDFGIAQTKHCNLIFCSFVLQIDWSKSFSDGPSNNMWCKWLD